jgi:hypothetical protein
LVKTISKTIRLLKTLFDLVMSCNQNKSFADVVRDLLTREYSFTNYNSTVNEMITPNICNQPNVFFNVESKVDEILSSCVQQEKNKELKKK